MNLDNVYSFTVQRQNSADVAPGKSPCVKIKFIKDESIKSYSPKYKLGIDNVSEHTSFSEDDKPDLIADDGSGSSPLSICPIYNRDHNGSESLRLVLIELHKLIEKKDSHMIFAYPVTEEQAPNYSKIIDQPMDLQSIHNKIHNGTYKCMVDMVDDVVLMGHNALIYNTSDTVYYKIASQMINFVKKIFSRETLNKFVTNKLNWTRTLTDEEMGDWVSSLGRIKKIQNEVVKNTASIRPHRALQRSIHHDEYISKRKAQVQTDPGVSKKTCTQKNVDTVAASERSESELDENCSYVLQSEMSEDSVGDDDNDDGDIDAVLQSARRAADIARQRLVQSRARPVVHLDRVGDNVSFVDDALQQTYPLENEFQSMVNRIGSANIDQMLGDNDHILAQLGHLCYDTNEYVTLTTSKPLEPYSFAEQAVLVETFGDVVTAEFACNMHNFVLDMPSANNAAVALVKNKLNTATNYLTYGVDQIIIKKLRAASEAARNYLAL